MCGIAGFWLAPTNSSFDFQGDINRMIDAIHHRGPDGHGVWVDHGNGLALGHRRLSIIELSDSGSQPMESLWKRYIVSYNGEIYNHLELRKLVQNSHPEYTWRGSSDTETILATLDVFGIQKTLNLCIGMFAIAIWDIQNKQLFLARDRFGEKPLYYFCDGSQIIFASELKSLRSHANYRQSLNANGLSNYIKRGYVDEMNCIYSKTHKVTPGHFLSFSGHDDSPDEHQYWSHASLVTKKQPYARKPFSEHSKQIENTLTDVIQSQMMSDVPLGSFLSGGIDSSLVTAIMQKNSLQPIKTFTVGFEEDIYNEARYAENIAKHLGTDHTSFILKEADALALIPDLASIYDEPFADYSQIPTILLAREARKHVSVVLTGDGGDEIFGGYNRYILAPKIWRTYNALPSSLRKLMGNILSKFHTQANNPLLQSAINKFGLSPQLLLKAQKISNIMADSKNFEEIFDRLTSTFENPQSILQQKYFQNLESLKGIDLLASLDPSRWMMLMDSLSYLPGDILTKVDRASMSASLETRAPFLDQRVVTQAAMLNLSSLIKNGNGKVVLRNILKTYIPSHHFDRPKQGFTIPLDKWLREELRDWAEALLSEESIKKFNILQYKMVRLIWEQHISHDFNHGAKLWTILMLQSWLETWGDAAMHANSLEQ